MIGCDGDIRFEVLLERNSYCFLLVIYFVDFCFLYLYIMIRIVDLKFEMIYDDKNK